MLSSRDAKAHDEQMGLLLRFPTRKPGEEHQRYTTAPVVRPAHKTDRQTQQTGCGHRLLSVDPIVSLRVEGGYAARCLLCGTTGPVKGNGEAARLALLEQMVRNDQ
jgi:hypothetical protein